MPEYEAKAQFLINFIKYVSWPRNPSSKQWPPVVLGILGRNDFNHALDDAVNKSNTTGRTIIIKYLSFGESLDECTIIFVSASEDSRLKAILNQIANKPILSVGESSSFIKGGGIINLTLHEQKIHLEINLKAANAANIIISSKLLSVADSVNK